MQHFYDGQIRRYLGQIIRMLSGFKYKDANGIETTVPVMYGDMTRQVGQIIKENSENKIPSAPRISVYITGLAMDRNRMGDSSYVSKLHIRERDRTYDDQGNFTGYTQTQGDQYTIERLMPTPYTLTVKADIWSTNTDQKLQIMEQILMLFNPSLEIQTTDNFIDWTSISVVNLTDINFSSRSIPVGNDTDIDIGSLTLETPIWISPPTKVKRLGVITDVIMNIFDAGTGGISEDVFLNTPTAQELVNVGNYGVLVYNNTITLLKSTNPVQTDDLADPAFTFEGTEVSWQELFNAYPGKFRNDVSQIFLIQDSGNKVVGRLSLDPLDPDNSMKLYVNWDQDTFPTNTLITSTLSPSGRTTVDAVIDPQRYDPRPYADGVYSDPDAGTRYLILEDIVDTSLNDPGAQAWGGFTAVANDIIEWNGTSWEVVLDTTDPEVQATTVYTTNLRTGIQYKFADGAWTKSFEGEYSRGLWRLVF